MNKRKGFTLIELLAVIVILSVIMVIAVPKILDVIENSRKSTSKSSAELYVDAIEKYIMINEMDISSKKIRDGIYSIEELNNLGVTVKGTKPNNGTIKVTNGKVKDYILGIDSYVVQNKKTTKVTSTNKYDNGTVIYYNPTTGGKCNSSDAVSTTGTKNGCMKWYVFNDREGNSTVNLILDHNTTSGVAWNSCGSIESGMKEVLESLINDTKDWKVPARLITANEIAKITNHPTFDANKTGQIRYCFETNEQDMTSSPLCNKATTIGWLFDYTYCIEESNNWGCPNNDPSTYGYWTSTPYAGNSSRVWLVGRYGNLDYGNVDNVHYGVRPVITVSKDIIK